MLPFHALSVCVLGAWLLHTLSGVVGESPAEQHYEPAVDVNAAPDPEQQLPTTGAERFLVSNYIIDLTNDGPTTLGSTVTFVATVQWSTDALHVKRSDEFLYVCTEVDGIFAKSVWSNATCTFAITFERQKVVGYHTFQVLVYKYITRQEGISFVGKANSTIEVTETINGKILASTDFYSQCNVTNPQCSVPTNTDVVMTADIHDPSSYFEEAFVLYHWDMGNGVNFTSTAAEITYKYSECGIYQARINVTALLPSGDQKYGWWNATIRTLDAIKKLSIEVNSTSVKVGSEETFNITCDGSPPIVICWTVMEPKAQNPNITNTTCETMHSDKCHTVLKYSFVASGTYQLKVAAQNNVSFAVNVSTVNAHYPPVLPPKSITAITTAIVFGLCLTFFGAAVVMQHIHKNKVKHVEVANFDFQFRERSASFMRFKNRMFGWGHTSDEEKPLLNKSSLFDSL